MDNDFLPEDWRNNLKISTKWSEYIPVDETADWLEPKCVPDERYAATDHDSTRREQGDGLCEGERDGGGCLVENLESVGIARASRVRD